MVKFSLNGSKNLVKKVKYSKLLAIIKNFKG